MFATQNCCFIAIRYTHIYSIYSLFTMFKWLNHNFSPYTNQFFTILMIKKTRCFDGFFSTCRSPRGSSSRCPGLVAAGNATVALELPGRKFWVGDPKMLREAAEIWGFPAFHSHGGTPMAGWFRRDNPTKMDDFGVPPFMESPKSMLEKWFFDCVFFGG